MARGQDVFERWTPIWHAFFYGMVLVATGLVLASWSSEGRNGPIGLVVALGLILLAWHAGMLLPLGRAQRERPARVIAYLAGAIALSTGLLVVDPIFLMVAMSLYNQVFAFLVLRWAVPVALALTAAIAASFLRTESMAGAIIVTVGAASALLFALFLTSSAEESKKRREIIEELERTRQELALAERLAGVTEERSRIARELHDTVTQQLVAIVMHLETASEPGRVKTAVDESLRLAREGLAEARRLVWADKPSQLESGALTKALADASQELRLAKGVDVELACGEELEGLPVAHQTLVLRGVREALANVRKHARAKRVTISATAEGETLLVDVHDDGAGFDPSKTRRQASGAGFGLGGLRERVESLGGTLTLESAAGEGTTVAFQVPLRAKSTT